VVTPAEWINFPIPFGLLVAFIKIMKFKIKNLSDNQKYYRKQIFRQRRAGFVLCLIICTVLFLYFFGNTLIDSKRTTSEALKQTITNPVGEVMADEDNRYCGDPQAYLRCKAQDLGIDDYTTSKIINMISTCENGKWNPEAININTDKHRSMDVGIMMVNLYWHPDVTLTEMIDYKKNIDYGLQMFLDQGFEPWTCAHKLGYI
jgi:hypothetical protein